MKIQFFANNTGLNNDHRSIPSRIVFAYKKWAWLILFMLAACGDGGGGATSNGGTAPTVSNPQDIGILLAYKANKWYGDEFLSVSTHDLSPGVSDSYDMDVEIVGFSFCLPSDPYALPVTSPGPMYNCTPITVTADVEFNPVTNMAWVNLRASRLFIDLIATLYGGLAGLSLSDESYGDYNDVVISILVAFTDIGAGKLEFSHIDQTNFVSDSRAIYTNASDSSGDTFFYDPLIGFEDSWIFYFKQEIAADINTLFSGIIVTVP